MFLLVEVDVDAAIRDAQEHLREVTQRGDTASVAAVSRSLDGLLAWQLRIRNGESFAAALETNRDRCIGCIPARRE